MADYRFYAVGSDGHFESSRDFICDTDENAVVWAKQLRPTALGAAEREADGRSFWKTGGKLSNS